MRTPTRPQAATARATLAPARHTLHALRTRYALLVLAFAACAPRAATVTPAPASATPLPVERVLHGSANGGNTFGDMLDTFARADAVFLGEQHDDAATHRLELAVLQGLAERGVPVTLALEMFERDVQALLDSPLSSSALSGGVDSSARPWPNYATDYRPLVAFARAQGWPVIASNVPRLIASAVSHDGLGALDSLPPSSRADVAREVACPDDAYRAKFAAEMAGMGAHGGSDSAAAAAMVQRFYLAQCVKDETMGESVARALAPGRVVVHVNGSFHSDERLGTVARLLRRRPDARAQVVSFVPAPLAATLAPDVLLRRGDWVVITTVP